MESNSVSSETPSPKLATNKHITPQLGMDDIMCGQHSLGLSDANDKGIAQQSSPNGVDRVAARRRRPPGPLSTLSMSNTLSAAREAGWNLE